MKFPLARFDDFCRMLVIDSKERGQIKLAPSAQLGTQRFFVEQIVRGLEEDVHFFVTLKGRQEGITTINGALDLFWHYEYAGMQGTFASHNEEARDNFRSMLTVYHDGLPKSHRIAIVQNNRYFISFKNRSRIAMQIGGGAKSKRSGGKGRGQAFTFMHATEVSSWEDEEALSSMLASLAQKNPRRLFSFESTARGYNLFADIVKDAKNAVTQRFIFIGWWLNRFYRCERDSPEYRVYWGSQPQLTGAEREWVRAVKVMYGYELEPEQMAWWRWMASEVIHDETLLMQEHPPHEELAFVLSGKNFFSVVDLEKLRTEVNKEARPQFYKVRFGADFMDTRCEETIEAHADLTVYEQPDERGFYSLGADPAHGSSDWADRFVISVWRCYADRFEQVAEFCVTNMFTYQFAWVLCFLAGAYRISSINLEVNGPGQAVLSEMDSLRQKASVLPRGGGGKELTNVVGHMQYYLYRRLDSPGGAGVAYHYITTQGTKERMLNIFKDLWGKGYAFIHSPELVDEMKLIVREDDGFLGASGRGKDDRVIAAALAAEQYERRFRMQLVQMKVTWGQEYSRREQVRITGHEATPSQDALSRAIGRFMHDAGVKDAA